MLHRTKKANDVNEGKWVGIGGKIESGETPEQCCIREVKEETNLDITNLKYRGIINFLSDKWPDEIMHLFTASTSCNNALLECNEGDLKWVPISDITTLPIWEGDKVFLELLQNNSPFFKLTLKYADEKLIDTNISYI